MDILNRKERTSAFLLFLLMFIITTGILIYALFFNYKLPWKENEVLKNENDKILTEFNFQRQFSDKIDDISKLVDSLDKAPESFPFIEQSITVKLAELNQIVEQKKVIPKEDGKDNPAESTKLYDNAMLNVKKLVNTKKLLLQLNDSKQEIEMLNKQIKSYEEDTKSLTRDLEICRQLNRR
ncbi:type VI secretion system TssO [Flavobacterium sp. '19STA2R22 D10 B1']|uniref:type VI secretion system TssO n=1 Tax=Flavobacterium aerium TaxID=3037261 RepID=UPI00278BE069|nr:type VI secretion system TssO [Flavobacterium sp. '19STA2R22 D10 B1']